jgi:hypothetical protein
MKRITLAVAFCLFLLTGDALAQLESAIEAARELGLSESAIERVREGEVVAEELESSSDKDLSLAIVMRLDAPVGRVSEFVNADRLAEFQTVTLGSGAIDPENFSLAEMTLPVEVLSALESKPEDTFFMSDAEAKRVAIAAREDPSQALDAYRAVLSARAKAYWEKGIAGIAPYAGKGRSPAEDLGHANEAARKIVRNTTFLAELEAAPAKSPGKATHKLSWAVEKGRDRAAPVLLHRILYRVEQGEIVLERRFYSGYDYDALQIVVAILPTKSDWSAVFYTNHTYTAQVAGFGGGAKRAIGKKLLESEIVAELQRAQKAIPAR